MFASNNFKVVKILLNKSIFDEHIVHIILKYYWDILDNKKKLLSNWVDKRKLTSLIYKNKYAFHYICENRECYIDWNILSSNPDAMYLLEMHKDNINWSRLCKNPGAIELLKNNKDQIIWKELSHNTNAFDLLKERVDYEHSLTINDYIKLYNKVDWMVLSKYKNEKIVELIEKRIIYESKISSIDYEYLNYNEHLNWAEISSNPFAIKIIQKYMNLIHMDKLSTNPNAIEILTNNMSIINWVSLSTNPNAINLLKKNKRKIHWANLCLNPNAIKLIKEQIELEKTGIYDRSNSIDWCNLCLNPNAIDIIKENKNKIDWFNLCINSNVIETKELIKEKMIEESNKDISKLNWYVLSSNPEIFEDEQMPLIN